MLGDTAATGKRGLSVADAASWKVGRIYDVQVVRANWCRIRADWPVLGPRHEDADHLDFPYQHWHLDGRFVSAALWRKVKTEGFVRSPMLSSPLDAWIATLMLPVMHEPPQPSDSWGPSEPLGTQQLRMIRHSPPDMWSHLSSTNFKLSGLARLTKAYRDAKLVNGTICPHRGADLRGMKPDADGCVRCPLHSLRWNLKTGRLAS